MSKGSAPRKQNQQAIATNWPFAAPIREYNRPAENDVAKPEVVYPYLRVNDVSPENFWRQVWHIERDKAGGCWNGVMKAEPEFIDYEFAPGDMIRLLKYRCLRCGAVRWGGVHPVNRQVIIVREAAAAT